MKSVRVQVGLQVIFLISFFYSISFNAVISKNFIEAFELFSLIPVLFFQIVLFLKNYNKSEPLKFFLSDYSKSLLPFSLLTFCLSEMHYSNYSGYPDIGFTSSSLVPVVFYSGIYLLLLPFINTEIGD